jgi:2-C-methyl-D-erythritol 2,4-cyclodiphosphate synthase
MILGGIEIPYEKGLLGHSDADVLLHAICDALLGALALGDIGKHFPDTDPKYKGADSTVLLKDVYKMVTERGYILSNCDSTVVLEKPKLREHIDLIQRKIAGLLDCSIDQISVKATTSEKMGFVGRGEGAVAFATVLLAKK